MLPGLGFEEIVALAVIALIVVGPKDLPLMLRKLGQFTARLRGLAAEFRAGFDELARQAELDELRKEVDALRKGQPFEDVNRTIAETAAMVSGPVAPPTPPESPPAPPIEEPPGQLPESPPAPPLEEPPVQPPESPPSPPLEIPPAPPRMARA